MEYSIWQIWSPYSILSMRRKGPTCLIFINKYLLGVWKIARSLEGVWGVYGRCFEVVWKVIRGFGSGQILQTFSWTQNFLLPTIIIHPKIFGTETFFETKYFVSAQNFFGPQISLGLNLWTCNFSNPLFFGLNFFEPHFTLGDKKIATHNYWVLEP